MQALSTSVPALIIIGAIVVPCVVYLMLGLGERTLTLFGVKRATSLRPWFWLLGPLLLIAVILAYPLVSTVVTAFANARGDGWAGVSNFVWVFGSDVVSTVVNNLIWIIVFPIATLLMALVVAVTVDRVKYEKLAMTIIVLPTAVSFTAGSIIWRQLYSFQPEGAEQKGLLNALWTMIPGASPIPWLQTEFVNTLCLIFVAIWAGLGTAALILSAAVKNVPEELVEAARLDGAGELLVFRHITAPFIMPAVLVVITTEIIFALKIFDIVYVMTNGNFNSNVLANRMYYELFSANNLGHASAIAVVLLIAALPVVIINIRQFRSEGTPS
jgi:alpha-glucoside transport system permease protein